MKPYSKEFRGQVLAACDRVRSTCEVATYFEVSESWVRRIKQERRELNKTAPLLKRRRTPLWAALADRMREIIQRKPELTLRELKSELQTDLSVQTLCTALQRLRLTVKKSPHRRGARAARRRGEAGGVAAGAAAAESGAARLLEVQVAAEDRVSTHGRVALVVVRRSHRPLHVTRTRSRASGRHPRGCSRLSLARSSGS